MGLLDSTLQILGQAGNEPTVPKPPGDPFYRPGLGPALSRSVQTLFRDPQSSEEFRTFIASLGDRESLSRTQARTQQYERLAGTAGLTGGARARTELATTLASSAIRSDAARQFLANLFARREATAANLIAGARQFELGRYGTEANIFSTRAGFESTRADAFNRFLTASGNFLQGAGSSGRSIASLFGSG